MNDEVTYLGLAWSEHDEFWWPGYRRPIAPNGVFVLPKNLDLAKIHGTMKRHHDKLVLFATGALEIDRHNAIIKYCSFGQPWLVSPGDEVRVELLRATMEKA
jgi:hypothetical protein